MRKSVMIFGVLAVLTLPPNALSTVAYAQASKCDWLCRQKCDNTAGKRGTIGVRNCYKLWGQINSQKGGSEARKLEGKLYVERNGNVVMKGDRSRVLFRYRPIAGKKPNTRKVLN